MTSSSANDGWPYPVYASSRVTEHKSAFLAHATTLKDTSELETLLEHLRALPRMKKTTHCMLAYRISGPSDGPVNTGQDDGGEGGAGDRLARLLELSGRENVVVVVWRWYGGVKLGSDRWKRISDVAKEALAQGDFVKPSISSQPPPRNKKKR
ncbi:ribosomal protein S5 domain 2-type protein [Schizophyllum amplum]|uniref:Ribosomal protein S5 domain 2-type protein n=1 Tax=Schizophyllum amplum TaxID=97359 RepID=A0A550CWP5_9AGAR|nr:ribosomal protein S5 domain 2-type protein [Auriculariopsis ampla]